jgi:Tfp pilus assembly protein PilO
LDEIKGMNLSAAASFKQSPYYLMAIKLGVACVILFTVLGLYFFYWSPALDTQELQIDEMEDAKVELHQLEAEILALNEKLDSLASKKQLNNSRLFVGSELIQLNRNINQFAAESDVRILSMEIQRKEKLEKSPEEDNFDDGSDMMGDDGSDMMGDDGSDMMGDDGFDMMGDGGSNEIKGDDYFTVPVAFKVKGGYLDYLTFRARLSSWEKAVNINSESITAGQGRYKGVVTVAGVFRVAQKMKAKGEF